MLAQVSVTGSSTVTSWYSLLPITRRPSASTAAGASPMHCQWFGEPVEGGAGSGCHRSATGSKIMPMFDSVKFVWPFVVMYSPPTTATRPSASTAEANACGM